MFDFSFSRIQPPAPQHFPDRATSGINKSFRKRRILNVNVKGFVLGSALLRGVEAGPLHGLEWLVSLDVEARKALCSTMLSGLY